jgi:hypothetical protein
MKRIKGIAHDTYSELERLNPDYRRKLNDEAAYDTPLFDGAKAKEQGHPVIGPARTIKNAGTRENALRELQMSGKIAHLQMEVLRALDEIEPASIRTIAKHIGAQTATVSGRIAELRDELSLIVYHDKIKDHETNQTVIRWKLNPNKF